MLDLSPDEWIAIRLSLKIALVATVVALPFGIAIAWLLARKNFWGKALLDGLVHMPLVLPPVVTGYLLLISFGRRGPIGAFLADHFGIVFSFRWTGAALSCGVMGFPLLVRPIRLAIEAIDRKLEDAAATLGADRLWVFLTVTLPLAMPGLIAGLVLCFAKALGEFGATITFVSNIPGETQTISAAIYTFTQIPGGDAAAGRLVLVAIASSRAAPAPASTGSEHALDRRGETAGRLLARGALRGRRRRHRPLWHLGRRQDHARQHDRRADRARPRTHPARRYRAVRLGVPRPRALAPPTHRLCVPGGAAVPASQRGGQPRLRPAHVRTGARRCREDADREPARHRPLARSPAREAFRWRAPARRHRPRAAGAPAPASARRAARLARRGEEARDLALSREAARRDADGLCQPPRRRIKTHRHLGGAARQWPRGGNRRHRGARRGDGGANGVGDEECRQLGAMPLSRSSLIALAFFDR